MAEHALAADEIRALRRADHLVFSTHDGRTEVRAIVDQCNSSTGFEQHRDIPCDGSVVDYERPGTTCAEVSAFHMQHYSKTDHIATVTRHIAKGDRLMLLWRRNNNTESHRAVSFVADESWLDVIKSSGRTDRFLIHICVGRDNTARMIRVA